MLGLLPGLRQQAHDRLMVAMSVLGVCVAAMYAPVVHINGDLRKRLIGRS
jgi:hypothetical protein